MKITRLRLTGFKSFVEAADFRVEPGLTGIVGPNGCGKSNLVEGLRWVMGEGSHKALRASEMDDVIFAGSAVRPGRNIAEVMLGLDNAAHEAPAPWTHEDTLEITRRIERGKGSAYRINGREVRARDVQILFADASTGARSPALVRQGQIGEIVNAKPEARRRVLEEAAGIAGLHARRHEAEARLNVAEQNLLRIGDTVEALAGQIEGLKRQARQAARYRQLSADIRRLEAVVLERVHAAASADLAAAARAVDLAQRDVVGAMLAQAEAARAEGVAAHAVPALREAAAAAMAASARLRHAAADLDRDEKQARARLAELERTVAALAADAEREERLAEDARQSLARLDAEGVEAADEGADRAAEEAAEGRWREAAAALSDAEAAVAGTTARLAEHRAARDALVRSLADASARAERLVAEVEKSRKSISSMDEEDIRHPLDDQEMTAAEQTLAAAEASLRAAESRADAARAADSAAATPLKAAEATLRRIEVEVETINKLLRSSEGDGWSRAIDAVTVEPGWEAALGAAFADDLDAALDAEASAHWKTLPELPEDPALPEGVDSLAIHVTAPPALARRLAQIGTVTAEEGTRLQPTLATGQSLVTREGAIWRWDGYTETAQAPSVSARRLAERNRLAERENDMAKARAHRDHCLAMAEAARTGLAHAVAEEGEARQALRAARQALDGMAQHRAATDKALAARAARRGALIAAGEQIERDLEDAKARRSELQDTLERTSQRQPLEARLAEQRAMLERQRAVAGDLRAARDALMRQREDRSRRREALRRDHQAWTLRLEDASARARSLACRRAEALEEQEALRAIPQDVETRRRALVAALHEAEAAASAATTRLDAAETARAEAAHGARLALETLSVAREALARAETRRDAEAARREEAERRLREALGRGPAGVPESEASLGDLTAELDQLKRDRERLGGVNLQAEEELGRVQLSHDGLTTERDDLTEAVHKLRQAIGALNREGRERLAAAFTVVGAHFEHLFTTLFGGGEARLMLVESDDPLAAGLEIVACPPGKKTQVLSLLSGGEQALTAMALVFAIFLTNPAPICVLDEVDAPLDDANVERFCDLLDAVRARTDTRFLVVTHNPVTMSRMDRLFGVTMAEKGVSQLVSVDLETAGRLREAV